jgi:methionyl aminopeptidase
MQRQRSVVLKSPREIETMWGANQHVAEILLKCCEQTTPGISTWDIDQICREELRTRELTSPFLGYHGYPAVVCTSVNEEIVHGIPRKDKVLSEGDIIGIDFGVVYKGYVGDSARTIVVGDKTLEEAQTLIDVTKRSLDAAIEVVTSAHRISDIGKRVQGIADAGGYGIVREFVGHGIGTRMHEDPQIPNYYDGPKKRLRVGLVIAIEPMLNLGGHEVRVLDDGWTAVTRDGCWSAHFEDTVAVTEKGPRVLSRLPGVDH